ncbi:serine/threonine-protein kinase [Yinghuangia seranimata]|uniref:serine/threonine-protein kinase n=1 Tax=Yinghuangia seranimata TaxID=408067 RepID=UPI00248CEA8F|nr:serine/threonine-protein kinase [Yinghuangia seranimata]MDI2126823.1 serine/threonine-protein kinase [Yinghuangia seranimata]
MTEPDGGRGAERGAHGAQRGAERGGGQGGERVVAGRYRLGEMLGRGGMGTVWQAHDAVLDRIVALKEVRVPDELDDEERGRRSARAMREVRAAALVAHPNVVVVYDVVEHDLRPWIVMEFVPGRTLAEDLDEGRLPVREAARVARQIIDALRAVHAADVVHRDVKPANVLLARDGRAVLTDFGIATLVGSTTITATGTTIGTLEYMSPERALGVRPGPASDLWSAGATLYEMVEGRSPFRRNGEFATLQAVMDGQYDPPRHAGALEPVLAGLLTADPDQRMTAEAAIKLLTAVEAGTPGAVVLDGVPAGATDGGRVRGGVDPAAAAVTVDGVPAPRVTRPERTSASAAVGYTAPVSQTSGQGGSSGADLGDAATWGPAVAAGQGGPAVTPTAGSDGAGSGGGGRRRRLPLVLGGTALVVAAAVVVVLLKVVGGDSKDSHDAASPAASGAAASPSAPAGTGPSASPVPPSSTNPAGYHQANDQAGFSVLVPDGWTRDPKGDRVFFRSSDDSLRLGVRMDPADASGDAYKDLAAQAGTGAGSYPGYTPIQLTRTTYKGNPAVVWEFTWSDSGVQRRTVNLRYTANGHTYDFWVSGPEAQSPTVRGAFDQAKSSFTPTR